MKDESACIISEGTKFSAWMTNDKTGQMKDLNQKLPLYFGVRSGRVILQRFD